MLPELTTNQKGAIAETAVVYEATKLRIEVYRPVSEGGRFDLIVDLGERLVRVQCVRYYSARRTRDGVRKRHYTADEIDAFAAYCPELDRCYFLPVERFPDYRAIQLRLSPPRNSQRIGVNWASEFEFAARLSGAGP